MKKILLTTTALHQPWNEGDWDMTDGNTYAISKHLDEREDWDALQEVYAELEQAEARIEELEDTLSLRTNLHGEATYLINKLEAKLKAKEKLMLALAGDKIDLVSELAGVKGKLAKAREEGFWAGRSCGGAKKEIDAALAELKGKDDG